MSQGGTTPSAPSSHYLVFLLSIPLWLALARVYGLYDSDETRTDHSSVDDLFSLFNMLTVGTWAFFIATWLTGVAHPTVPKLLLFWGSAILFVALARGIARSICRNLDSYVQNTVIVGAGHVGQSVAHKLLQHPEYGVNLVGFVDAHPRERRNDLDDLTVLGKVDELPELVDALDIERVIIAFSQAPHTESLAIIRELNGLDVQVDMVPRMFEVLGPQATIHGAEGIPLLGLPPGRLPWSSLIIKRAMDVMLTLLALIVLSPAASDHRDRDQARFARASPVQTGADGQGRSPLQDPQVPHHDRRRRRAKARGRPPQQARRGRRPDVQDPGRPAHHPRWPRRSEGTPSTSCHSSSTSSKAT